jgi:hypothetical protein
LNNSITTFRTKYKKYEGLTFFIIGFLFDVFTLRRIDDWLKLGFQVAFVFLLALFLLRDYRWKQKPWEPFGGFRKIWKYEVEIVHFLFGSLLSAFVIFYFKSSSLSHSLFFLSFLAILMVMNESTRFREQGLTLRICLWNFCLSSFLIYFLPLIFGYLSTGLFILAIFLSSIIFSLFIFALYKLTLDKETYKKTLLWKHVLPSVGVTVFLLTTYFLKIIPPVPLSMTFGGIYHNIEKENGNFKLYSLKPWYRFWSHGDYDFLARDGEKIFCFVRVFAPAKFSDKVYVRWSTLDSRSHSYETQDRIIMPLSGGREEGFRGSTFKANYHPGLWRVSIETEDERVIGTIDFKVEVDPSSDERVWKVEES